MLRQLTLEGCEIKRCYEQMKNVSEQQPVQPVEVKETEAAVNTK